ncbi:low temperature requirement protein A [Frateuria aurantia]
MEARQRGPVARVLRSLGAEEARVTQAELFFDLIYAFAITQLSHYLLTHLSLIGACQTLLLWFAVWLGWQFTCWTTNWFDPETMPVRLMLLAIMLLGLLMASAVDEAFEHGGWLFAGSFAGLQVGRSLFGVLYVGRGSLLRPNMQRLLGWNAIAAAFWLVGAACEGPARMLCWAAGALCDFVSPMLGLPLPGLGRSHSERDWVIDGGHLAERCQLFVMMALGESIIAAGSGFAESHVPVLLRSLSFLASFVGSVAMWWLYFDTSSEDGSRVIRHSRDPGRTGAHFHYIHVLLIAGIIVSAVGDELMLNEGGASADMGQLMVLLLGPALYLAGNALYKRIVYGAVPRSHVAGVVVLLLMLPLQPWLPILVLGSLSSVLVLVIATFDGCRRRAVQGGGDHHQPV